jgi:hypothetical protein
MLAALASPGASIAQNSPDSPNVSTSSLSSVAYLALPDAPGLGRDPLVRPAPHDKLGLPEYGADAPAVAATSASMPEASHTEKYVEPGQAAPQLSVKDKALLGVRDAFSPFAALGWLAASGVEQWMNDSPNYGTGRGAFGQRLGAAVLRDSSEGILSDSVMSPLLREDPRYYRLGPAHNLFVRLAYAATRTIVTRTDSGRTSPNFALIAGNAAGAALPNLYYPQPNRGLIPTMQTLGGSIEGSALGDVVSEFFADCLGIFHSAHK